MKKTMSIVLAVTLLIALCVPTVASNKYSSKTSPGFSEVYADVTNPDKYEKIGTTEEIIDDLLFSTTFYEEKVDPSQNALASNIRTKIGVSVLNVYRVGTGKYHMARVCTQAKFEYDGNKAYCIPSGCDFYFDIYDDATYIDYRNMTYTNGSTARVESKFYVEYKFYQVSAGDYVSCDKNGNLDVHSYAFYV